MEKVQNLSPTVPQSPVFARVTAADRKIFTLLTYGADLSAQRDEI
ncbi:hypothetical protein [Couchioplanes caeruleus]|nr:hypothetical protein [Couchioplanes caeruleus]